MPWSKPWERSDGLVPGLQAGVLPKGDSLPLSSRLPAAALRSPAVGDPLLPTPAVLVPLGGGGGSPKTSGLGLGRVRRGRQVPLLAAGFPPFLGGRLLWGVLRRREKGFRVELL